jgi:hypothetical protein
MLKRTPKEKTKIEKRVEKLSTPDLIQWSEQALYTIGRNLTDYIRHHDVFVLDETLLGTEALHAIMKELKRRH